MATKKNDTITKDDAKKNVANILSSSSFTSLEDKDGQPLFLKEGEVFTGVFLGEGRILGEDKYPNDKKKHIGSLAFADLATPVDAVMRKILIPKHDLIVKGTEGKFGDSLNELIGKAVFRITYKGKVVKDNSTDSYHNYEVEARGAEKEEVDRASALVKIG